MGSLRGWNKKLNKKKNIYHDCSSSIMIFYKIIILF
jgi:hypothetical protein